MKVLKTSKAFFPRLNAVHEPDLTYKLGQQELITLAIKLNGELR